MKHSAINPLKLTLVGVFSVMVANQTKAQSQNWWRTDGNSNIGVNNFVGTTNSTALNFRTNNVNRIGISSTGDITFNSLAGNGIGLMMHDANGKLISLPTTGQGDKVLMDNGQFVPISSFNTGWTLSSNKTISNVPFVGINTNNPTEALTINGNALVYGTLTTNGLNVLHKIEADTIKSGVRLNVNGTLVLGEDGGYNGIASRNDELRLNSKPGVDKNVIISANNNGNVGIGVVNPQEKLELAGNAKVYGNVFLPQISNLDEDATNNLLFIDQSGQIVRGPIMDANNFIGYELECFPNGAPTWANSPGILYTGTPVCPAYVGINTNTPAQALHVLGSGIFSANLEVGQTLKIGNSTIYLSGAAQPGTTNDIYATGDLYFQSNPSQNFNTIINSGNTGNVGIGMNAPGHKLEVAGTVRACKFIAENNSWCDYVFSDDYELMPLDQVSEYIKRNKHLPGVPSEKEVLNTDIDLLENDKMLLRKIEELTLYVIELKEENLKLKDVLNELNK